MSAAKKMPNEKRIENYRQQNESEALTVAQERRVRKQGRKLNREASQ